MNAIVDGLSVLGAVLSCLFVSVLVADRMNDKFARPIVTSLWFAIGFGINALYGDGLYSIWDWAQAWALGISLAAAAHIVMGMVVSKEVNHV
ncbi:MAG: hypothetical protein LBI48_09470 [Burkholderiaceae bacterium]|nr:hypothetical protein [Burkholderiaceae bacterium]